MSFVLLIIYALIVAKARNHPGGKGFFEGEGFMPHWLVSRGNGLGYLSLAILGLTYFGALFGAGVYGLASTIDLVFTMLLGLMTISGVLFLASGDKQPTTEGEEKRDSGAILLIASEDKFLELSRSPQLCENMVHTALPILNLMPKEFSEQILTQFPGINVSLCPPGMELVLEQLQVVVEQNEERLRTVLAQKQQLETQTAEVLHLREELQRSKEAVASAQEALNVIRSKHRERPMVDYTRMTKSQRDEEAKKLMTALRRLKEADEKTVTQTTLPLTGQQV